ncbi:MAG: hypothetical protein WDN48_07630 [Pseudolabrys sp.]
MKKEDENYSDDVAAQRFEKLVISALNTRPKPLKSMEPKGTPSQSKKRRKKLNSMRQNGRTQNVG